MRRRHTEERILTILHEADSGRKVGELCRSHGIAKHTFNRWKAKFGGMQVSDAKRLRRLEDENRKLKSLVADLTLDNQTLKGLVGRKW